MAVVDTNGKTLDAASPHKISAALPAVASEGDLVKKKDRAASLPATAPQPISLISSTHVFDPFAILASPWLVDLCNVRDVAVVNLGDLTCRMFVLLGGNE